MARGQRALLCDPRSARRARRFHHRARDQPDVRRADRAVAAPTCGTAPGGRPSHYVELGPGRGTLAADALRAMAKAGLDAAGPLRRDQPGAARGAGRARARRRLASTTSSTLPDDRAAARRRQRILRRAADPPAGRDAARAGTSGWSPARTRCSCRSPGRPCPTRSFPRSLRDAAPRIDPRDLARRVAIAARPRRAARRRRAARCWSIDYGYDGPALGDTLQAVRGHAYANPFEAPGEHDLTAHVDFATLAAAAQAEGARRMGPVDAGRRCSARSASTRAPPRSPRAAPDRADAIAADRDRLIATTMGDAVQGDGAHRAGLARRRRGSHDRTIATPSPADGPALDAMAQRDLDRDLRHICYRPPISPPISPTPMARTASCSRDLADPAHRVPPRRSTDERDRRLCQARPALARRSTGAAARSQLSQLYVARGLARAAASRRR